MEGLRKIRLKSREDRRFRMGHPWVYSNELQESPKTLELGEVVQLHDASGGYLATGTAHPHSLIAFRALTRDPEEVFLSRSEIPVEFFKSRFEKASEFRDAWFSRDQSARLVFGEADGLPGLVIDRFVGRKESVLVVQPHSAGMDLNLKTILEALKEFGDVALIRRDASSREREGLERFPIRGVDLGTGTDLPDLGPYSNFLFRVSGIMGSSLELATDLVNGQKTGFFFDQLQNIRLLETLVLRKLRLDHEWGHAPIKVLDLCSYVGQWSVHLLQTFRERGVLDPEFTCVDSSAPALERARENLERSGPVRVRPLKADVLTELPGVPDHSYSIVIADPPAFIKNRKSIPQGKQAYVQLFQKAIEKTSPRGLVVCCSCSQLLEPGDFIEVLAKAARRSGRTVRWLTAGSPSFDHFTRLEFQEGHYLKSYIAQVD